MHEVFFMESADDDTLKFAAVVSRCHGRWVFCREKGRDTYEIPGGSRKSDENIEETARRWLYEKTGAARFCMVPVCVYKVKEESGGQTFGMLYFAEIQEFFALPDPEMWHVEFFDGVPGELTYPDIEPALLHHAEEAVKKLMP